jgi:hypothetical protein
MNRLQSLTQGSENNEDKFHAIQELSTKAIRGVSEDEHPEYGSRERNLVDAETMRPVC